MYHKKREKSLPEANAVLYALTKFIQCATLKLFINTVSKRQGPCQYDCRSRGRKRLQCKQENQNKENNIPTIT